MHDTPLHTQLAQLLSAPSATLDALEPLLDALATQPDADRRAALGLIAQHDKTPIVIDVSARGGLGADDGESLALRWALALQRLGQAAQPPCPVEALAALATPLILRAQFDRFIYPAQPQPARQQVVLPLMALAATAPPSTQAQLVRAAAAYFIHAQLPDAMHDPAAANLAKLHNEPTDALFVQLLPLATELQLVAWLNRLIRSDRERARFVVSRGWPDLLLAREQSPNVLAKLLELEPPILTQHRLQCAQGLLAARNPALVRVGVTELLAQRVPLTRDHLPRLWHARTGADEAALARLDALIASIRAAAREGEQPGSLQLVEDDRHGQLSLASAERGALSPADGPLLAPAAHGALLNHSERAAIRSAWRDLAPAPRPEPDGLSSALIGVGNGSYMSLVWCIVIAEIPWIFFLAISNRFANALIDAFGELFVVVMPFLFAFVCFLIGRWRQRAVGVSDHTVERLAQHGHAAIARVLSHDGRTASLSIDGAPPVAARGLTPNTPVGTAVPILYDPVAGEALVLDAVPMLKVSTDGELIVPRELVLQGRILATLGGLTLIFFMLFIGLTIILYPR